VRSLVLGNIAAPRKNLKALGEALPDDLPVPLVGLLAISLGLADEDLVEQIPPDASDSVWIRFGAHLNPHAVLGVTPRLMLSPRGAGDPLPLGFTRKT